MATVKQRIIAASGAIVFFISTIALTLAVVISAVQDKKKASPTATTASSATCDIRTPVPSETVTAPEAYKSEGKTDSLKITDLEAGNGKVAAKGDCLVMKYQGSLAADGTIFDENYSKPQALQFNLGAGQVIQGWDQGLEGMKVGGIRRLVIPAALGYGSQGQGSIPANADLVFVVKLVKIK